MCHYVTAVLPANADHAALDMLAERHGRCFRPLENAGVVAQLRPGEHYFLNTAGYCDCGTALGASLRTRSSHGDRDEAEHRRKLRLKGWGETKIERWLEQRSIQAGAKAQHHESRQAQGDAQWRQFLSEVLESGHTPYVGLLLHFYDGAVSARFKLASRQTVNLVTMPSDFPGMMQEDVLYEFRR